MSATVASASSFSIGMRHALSVHRKDNKVNNVRGIVVEDVGGLKVLLVIALYRANKTATSTLWQTCDKVQSQKPGIP